MESRKVAPIGRRHASSHHETPGPGDGAEQGGADRQAKGARGSPILVAYR